MAFNLKPELDVYVVNLDRDIERMDVVLNQFDGLAGFRVLRHSGFLGSTLPAAAARPLVGANSSQKGALGCFLAHVGVWERIVASKVAYAVVIEDDAELLDFDRIFRTALPDPAELVFCNARMDPDGLTAGYPDRRVVIPQPVDIRRQVRRKAVKRSPPGTDGYIVSGTGAAKLVRASERDLYRGHVDWRMLRYCIPRKFVEGYFPQTWLSEVWSKREMAIGWDEVVGFSLSPALIRHRPYANSMRRGLDHPEGTENGSAIIELEDYD